MGFRKNIFKQGDRVKVNVPNSMKDRPGTVSSIKLNNNCVRVLFDGLKIPQTIHSSFCKLISEENPAPKLSGYRFFHCTACNKKWKEKCRDAYSLTHSYCAECISPVSPEERELRPEWEVDESGNLKEPYNGPEEWIE